MLVFGYNDWSVWDTYNPSAGIVGPQKVTFDGINKLILINHGEVNIDVKVDIYSGWKEWQTLQTNTKFQQAIRAVGGDPISDTINLGSTFFLLNGWKIRTWEDDHNLIVTGNLYSDDGSSPYIPTLGKWTTSIATTKSNLIDQVEADVSDINITTEEVTGGLSVAQFLALKD